MYTFNNIINEIKRQTTTRQKKIKKKKIVVLSSTITQEGFTSTFTKQQPEELSAKIKEKFLKKKNKN